jgi:hypothetical protein
MIRYRLMTCAVTATAVLLVGGMAHAADSSGKMHRMLPNTNIKYAMPAVPGNATYSSDDTAVLGQKGHRLWKGVPFFLHANNGILKVVAESDPITTTVNNAVGVFLLGATEGIGDRDVTSIGQVTYVYDDGSEFIGNIMFHDLYQLKEQLDDSGNIGPEFFSEDDSIYSVVDDQLAQYNLDVIYHSLPKGNIINIIFEDFPDDDGDSTDSPIWIYGVTVATEP